jgi:hypothetical protein
MGFVAWLEPQSNAYHLEALFQEQGGSYAGIDPAAHCHGYAVSGRGHYTPAFP